jgi:hypothetical protein
MEDSAWFGMSLEVLNAWRSGDIPGKVSLPPDFRCDETAVSPLCEKEFFHGFPFE